MSRENGISPAGASLARAGLALAAAGGLLFFWRGTVDSYGIPKMLVMAGGAALAWAGRAAALRAGAPWRRTPLDAALLACFAALALATVAAADPLRALVGHYVHFFHGLLPMAVFAALFWAAAQASPEESHLPVLRAYLGAAALCGGHAILQALGLDPWSGGVPAGMFSDRVFGTVGGPVFLGSALVVPAPLALHFALNRRGGDRVLGAVASALVWAGLFLTLSRGSWLGALAGCAATLAVSRRIAVTGRRAAVLGAAVLALGAAGLWGLSRFRQTAASDSQRLLIWEIGLRIFRANPVTGIGPDSFKLGFRLHRDERFGRLIGWNVGQASAHSDVIEILATMGLVGIAAYAFLLWSAFGAFRKLAARGPPSDAFSAAAGAAVGLFVQAKVNPVSIAAFGPFCVLAGLAVARVCAESVPARPRLTAALPSLAAAGLAAAFATLVCADHVFQRAQSARAFGNPAGALTHFRRAIAINPAYADYMAAYAATVESLLPRIEPGPARAAALEELFAVSRRLRALHPGDLRGFHLLGAACLHRVRAGDKDCGSEGLEALALAQELDPYSLGVAMDRGRLAYALGDIAEARRAADDVERLRRLQARPAAP